MWDSAKVYTSLFQNRTKAAKIFESHPGSSGSAWPPPDTCAEDNPSWGPTAFYKAGTRQDIMLLYWSLLIPCAASYIAILYRYWV